MRSLAALRRLVRPVRDEEGSALVEFALTMPILIIFFFGLIQVCLASYMRQVVSESAREGTRYAMVHGATCVNASGSSCTVSAANVNSWVGSNGWPNLGGGAPVVVNTTFPDGNESPGSRVSVTVTYSFPFRIPMVPQSTLTLSATSVAYIVQ